MLNAIWQAKVGSQEIVLGLLIIWAIWQGAAPERAVAAVFGGILGLDRAYHALLATGWFWDGVDLGHVIIDAFGLLALVAIALRANRFYPICLASIQLFTLIAHVARSLMRDVELGAYGVLIVAPSYLLIVVFAAGLVLHRRRVRTHGPYRSWQTFSDHS